VWFDVLVGRPNVGKSTFFNYLVGKRISIVEDTPGVTRDRIYAEVEWRNKKFTLIDTGGIEPYSEDNIYGGCKRWSYRVGQRSGYFAQKNQKACYSGCQQSGQNW